MSEIEKLQADYDAAAAKVDAIYADYLPAREARDALYDQLQAAKAAAAPDHKWEGKIVTRQDTKREGSGYFSKLVPVTLRGVVETYRNQNIDRSGLYRPEIGEPLVRLFTATGKPGKKLLKLKPFRIGAQLVEWTLEETQ